MRRCIELAREAASCGEVPVGAVIVHRGSVIAQARNAQISQCDPTAHAEISCLRQAALQRNNYRLPDCTLYSTIEPCLMCAGAIMHARLSGVVFGASEPRAGAVGGEINYFEAMSHLHKIEIRGGVLEVECRALIQQFFRIRRAKPSTEKPSIEPESRD